MLKAIPPYVDRFVQKWIMRKADVIHLNSLNIKLAKKAKKLDKPVVAVLHAAPFPKETYEATNDYVDIYVAPSNFTRQNEEMKIGLKKIVVIHHGIDTELFNPTISREIARGKLGIPLNAKVILWNDRISPEKNLEIFVEAMRYVIREIKEAYVYIMGRAVVKEYYEKIKGSIKDLVKSGRARIHIGWIPHSKLPLLYRASDIFVRTSKYENFGLGVIEAMACGIPTVAPNATTFPEIIGDEITLYKSDDPIDLANKIMHLIMDKDLYDSVRGYQLARAQDQFNINFTAKKYIKLYSSLL
jgi:glycosyltransferase involved in cell wall biosynthesis